MGVMDMHVTADREGDISLQCLREGCWWESEYLGSSVSLGEVLKRRADHAKDCRSPSKSEGD